METVNILIEALPYIKKFHQQKIMIKYGGHAMIDNGKGMTREERREAMRDAVLATVVEMAKSGLIKAVL